MNREIKFKDIYCKRIEMLFESDNLTFFDDGTMQLYDDSCNELYLFGKFETKILFNKMKKYFNGTEEAKT